MILRPGLLAAGLICTSSLAGATPPRSAIYGNVHYIEEADDTVGMELRLHPGARPWIDFVLCEGECAQQVRLPIVLVSDGFSFDYVETGADPDGRPVHQSVHFRASYRGRDLFLRIQDDPADKLRPLRKPIALR